MKYLIIGLGEFGRTLALELTDKLNDVIGIDSNEHRVNYIKDRISLTYIMDATEPLTLAELPLKEVDCAIVAIGQSMDASLRTVAALKENGVGTIYARAIDDTHLSILKAMNIQKIFIPEKYAAQMYVKNYLSF
jgi:trk system potassium uptake protein TrkA